MKNKKAGISNFLKKKVMNKEITFPRKVKSKSSILLFQNKKAGILHENVIFIILNVVFFSIMLVFIYLQTSSVHLDEEQTAKQIALLIDASRPDTIIEINLKDIFEEAEKNGINRENVVQINEDKSLVIVKASEDSFFEYGYFNDVYVLDSIKVINKKKTDYQVLDVREKLE